MKVTRRQDKRPLWPLMVRIDARNDPILKPFTEQYNCLAVSEAGGLMHDIMFHSNYPEQRNPIRPLYSTAVIGLLKQLYMDLLQG
ncbi:hypothetical protein J6590_074686 [Homalodisca vitripennis]|nr:hypothetical protein J6590_074686 [Homalodisca vitripennis]